MWPSGRWARRSVSANEDARYSTAPRSGTSWPAAASGRPKQRCGCHGWGICTADAPYCTVSSGDIPRHPVRRRVPFAPPRTAKATLTAHPIPTSRREAAERLRVAQSGEGIPTYRRDPSRAATGATRVLGRPRRCTRTRTEFSPQARAHGRLGSIRIRLHPVLLLTDSVSALWIWEMWSHHTQSRIFPRRRTGTMKTSFSARTRSRYA